MTTRPLYQHGRHSAPIVDPNQPGLGRTKYDLIEKLRAIRNANDEALTAIDEYDPDLCVSLSACTTVDGAEKLLATWLDRREEVLRNTQERFRKLWLTAQANSSEGALDHPKVAGGPELRQSEQAKTAHKSSD